MAIVLTFLCTCKLCKSGQFSMFSIKVASMPISSRFVSKAKHSIIQTYAPTTNAEEAEVEQFYEGLQTF